MRRWIALIGCLFLLAGCGGGGSNTGSTNGLLAGRWVKTSNVPGSSFSLLLATSGSDVNGTGVYAIEAGRSGTIQVTGKVVENQFMLNLAYDTGVTAVYTGDRTDDNHISGTVQQPGSADYLLTLTRQ
jgi:hypothetical protein